jgi:hypothetical protein
MMRLPCASYHGIVMKHQCHGWDDMCPLNRPTCHSEHPTHQGLQLMVSRNQGLAGCHLHETRRQMIMSMLAGGLHGVVV